MPIADICLPKVKAPFDLNVWFPPLLINAAKPAFTRDFKPKPSRVTKPHPEQRIRLLGRTHAATPVTTRARPSPARSPHT